MAHSELKQQLPPPAIRLTTPPRLESRADSKMSIHEQSSANHCAEDNCTAKEYDDLLSRPAVPKTKSYMERLVPPSQENFERIAHIQEQKEEELRQRDRQRRHVAIQEQKQKEKELGDKEHNERSQAARLIQKTFRGHRTRRELSGFGLDASTRWISAIREAEFRESTRPRTREGTSSLPPSRNGEGSGQTTEAMKRWKKASIVARRAGHDDLESDSSSSLATVDTNASAGERERVKKQSDKLIGGRRDQAQMMGLQYFLEMVDVKHRYGSNLRTYHSEWKKHDTNENFFFWLDYGEGKNIEVAACPRDRLEREKIRYLSREERQYYLVKVDDAGRLRWAKNGARIDTTVQYKDSIHGIVPADDPTPAFDPTSQPRPTSPIGGGSMSSGSMSSTQSRRKADREAKYVDPAQDETGEEPGKMKRVTHLSASTIWNKLLRRSVKEGTWIFVADTSFRLYVGIKNSGAFQHSSFLQGSRISAAGLIKIKNGRISSLSPLSGHYRPPASNFRAFVKSLKEGGVDMTRVSISKSYVILVGLETYVKTRKKSKHVFEKILNRKEKIMAPEDAARREEEAKDKSQSAAREREVIEQEEADRDENRARVKVMAKIGLPREPKGHPKAERADRERVEGDREGAEAVLAEERNQVRGE